MTPEEELVEEISSCYADPLKFVLLAFPWGQPGPLAAESGPDQWQREFLIELGKAVKESKFDGTNAVRPLRFATASGHGVGKTAMQAWLALWIMSTRPYCQGTVTANTFTQLETKTWAALKFWHKLCITSHWFECSGRRMRQAQHGDNWMVSLQSSDEANSEAFAGQHAKTSTSFYIYDEGSAVPDAIYSVGEGGLLTGEPMEFIFGNPTRNTGKLYRAVFGSEQERYRRRVVDARTSRFSNKQSIQEWKDFYGEDSDFFRVRVRGLPPNASELQYIDFERINAAVGRNVEVLPDEPIIAGMDVSGGGSAWNIIRFRQGFNANVFPPVRISGERGRDRSLLIGKCSELLHDRRPGHVISALFVDSAFGAPIVERLHTLGHKNAYEVSFGGASMDDHCANMRAYMYMKLKEWLLNGSIPNEDFVAGETKLTLAQQIGLFGYHINKSNRLVLESKADLQKRGEASPDDSDALALTFARHVAPPSTLKPKRRFTNTTAWG